MTDSAQNNRISTILSSLPRPGRAITAGLVVMVLAGCATLQEPGSEAPEPVTREISDGPIPEQPQASEVEEKPTTVLYKGNDRVVSLPETREAIQLDGEAVTLNFEEAPMTEVVHAILGDILDLDYVIEHPLKGNITIRTRSPVPRDQLLPILESLLQSNGALMVRDPEDRYFVSASGNLSQMMPGVEAPGSEGAGYSTVVIPLEYISAGEMAEILKPVAPDSAFVRIDNRRNLLMLAGTRNQLEGWQEMISTFDVDQLQGMSVGIFSLENASVEDINQALERILSKEEGEDASAGLASIVRVMPLESLNSVLVVTPRSHYLDQVRTWIERLDDAQADSSESQLYVFPVQNGSAKHLAQLLGSIFGGSGNIGSGDSQRREDSGVAPGMESMDTGSSSARERDRERSSGGSTNFQLGDNVRVVADEANNSLLVYAPQREYEKIKSALERLDIVPAQVLIEASIIEVTLRDELRYGVQWFLEGGLGNDYEGDAIFSSSNSGNIGPSFPGFNYSITNQAGELRAVINALADDSLLNVISTPSIMVLDNRTAAIHVGDQQPIRSSETIRDDSLVSSSVEYKDTGVKLEVTPSVNAGGLVTMDVAQSVTDVGEVDSATGQRACLERNVSSRVAVRSGESVVLGGLIRDNQSSARQGLPLLHDIPLLGNLFGATTNESVRTELLVFITPRVIRDEQDLRDITREMRNRMKGLEHFDDLPLESMPGAATEKTESKME